MIYRKNIVLEIILIVIVFSLFFISWIPSKYVGHFSYIQLVFLIVSLSPALLLGTEWGLKWVRFIFGKRHIGIKFCILTFVVLRGYIALVGLDPKLSKIIYQGLATPLHSLALRHMAPFIFFIFIIFKISEVNTRNNYGNKKAINKDILTLAILFFLSFFQMTWVYSSRSDLLVLSRVFYLHVFFMIWIFVNFPLVLFLIQRKFSREDIGYILDARWKDLKSFLCIAPFFLIIPLVASSFNYLLPYPESLILWVTKFAYLTFVIALPAELLFRCLFISLLQNRFKEMPFCAQHRNIYAIAISSLAFGSMHYWAGIGGILFQTAFGVLLGVVFIKTRRILVPILLHSVLAMISSNFLFFK